MEAVAHLTVSGRSIPDPREILPPRKKPMFNRLWRITYGVFTMIDGSKTRPLPVTSRSLLAFGKIPNEAVAYAFYEERTQRVFHRGKSYLFSTGPIFQSNPTFFRAVDGSPGELERRGYIDGDDMAWSLVSGKKNLVLAYPYKRCDCGRCNLLLAMDPLMYNINARP